ncbi:MAG: alpha-galactosidase, partial [Microthrixaceae bacterium]|nr:alpha-galactosidase [Microthrixaceae bacterium]
MATLGDPIRVDAGGWGWTWVGDDRGRLRQVGVGPGGHRSEVEVDPHWYPDAFPTAGTDALRPPALRVTHADGTLTTRLVVRDVAHPEADHLVVRCVDELFPFSVEHHVRTHVVSGVAEQWSEIHHTEDGPVTLADYDSIAPFLLVDHAATATQFGGSGWADEWAWTTETLGPGTKVLDSLGGVQPHLQRSPCLLVEPDGPAGESSGQVIALSIAWGGNTRFALDVRARAWAGSPRELRLRAGANPAGAPYVLDPGRRFVTPTVAWIWTDRGRAAATAAFHRWTCDRVIRDPERRRPIVVNNWEATFFDFDEERLVGLVEHSADLGADLFLLDDGWFGTSDPRDDDTAGLGDWEIDRRKLPDGLAPVIAAATERGMRFGLWLEPEMVNPASDLYRSHPDWIVRNGRGPLEHRNQFVLDPLRPEVRDFILGVFDRTLTANPDVSYVKWDANRPITDPGSATLGSDRQANIWVDHVHATWEVMAEVARRHPGVELMACASGGGRNDHGTLRWFHEFWTSDNTDPLARVRMQWACSHFFPALVMAAHVTRWGDRPLEFACAVALSGRFGIDLDLAALSAQETDTCRRAIELARRTQDLVQFGYLTRLVSPLDGTGGERAALAYCSPDRRRAVVFAYQLEDSTTEGPA